MNQLNICLAAAAVVLCASLPAQAEVIHLKNGTQVNGKITRETPDAFTVKSYDAERMLLKLDVQQYAPASPTVAFISSLMLPGSGHLYASRFDRNEGVNRAGFFLGLSALGAGAGYLASREMDPSMMPLTILIGAGIPAILSAFDAAGMAGTYNDNKKYVIEY